MNHRESTHPHAAARRALRYCSLLLLPTLAPTQADAMPRVPAPAGVRSKPYLQFVGAPQLRFQEALPPPDIVARPPAAAPPQPALTNTENSVAADNAAATRSVTTPPMEEPSTAESTPEVETPTKTIPPILPDEARPQVRPEDFLPYFQIPGSARQSGDVTLLVPAPFSAPTGAPLPASSATYTQTPK